MSSSSNEFSGPLSMGLLSSSVQVSFSREGGRKHFLQVFCSCRKSVFFDSLNEKSFFVHGHISLRSPLQVTGFRFSFILFWFFYIAMFSGLLFLLAMHSSACKLLYSSGSSDA